MKKLLIFTFAILYVMQGVCFGGWTCTPTEVTEYDDGANVTFTVTDGVDSMTLTRPIFRPTEAVDISAQCKTWIKEVKDRIQAQKDIVKAVAKIKNELNKPVPEAVA